VFAVEGPAWLAPHLEEDVADSDRRERILRLVRRVEQAPSILGTSPHLLAIARRRDAT
jgi:hypothetical protein